MMDGTNFPSRDRTIHPGGTKRRLWQPASLMLVLATLVLLATVAAQLLEGPPPPAPVASSP